MRPSTSLSFDPPIPNVIPFELHQKKDRTWDRWPDWQLDVICGMLGTMDTLTVAGQQHLMRKIVEFFRSDIVARKYRPATERQARFRAHLTAQLGRESARPTPDADLFRRRSARLVRLLRAAHSATTATGR